MHAMHIYRLYLSHLSLKIRVDSNKRLTKFNRNKFNPVIYLEYVNTESTLSIVIHNICIIYGIIQSLVKQVQTFVICQ